MAITEFLTDVIFLLPNAFWLVIFVFALGANTLERNRYDGIQNESLAEMKEMSDDLNINPLMRTSGTVGNVYTISGYILTIYTYTVVFSTSDIVSAFSVATGQDVAMLIWYETVSSFGPAQHLVYFPLYALVLILASRIVFVFVLPLASTAVSSIVGSLVIKALTNLPIAVVLPSTATFYYLHRVERNIRYVLAGRPHNYDGNITWVKSRLKDLDFSEVDSHFSRRWTTFLRGLSYIETLAIAGIALLVSLRIWSRGLPNLPGTEYFAFVSSRVIESITVVPLETIVGVWLVFQGRTFVSNSSFHSHLHDRLYVTLFAGVAVLSAILFNPSSYVDWVPRVYTFLDYLIPVYVLLVAATFTVHLLDHAEEVSL
jgi:hypothetical protein